VAHHETGTHRPARARPIHFQSVSGGPNFCIFYAIAPSGSRPPDPLKASFWKRVVETAACKGTLHDGDWVRIRAVDKSWDALYVIDGFRSADRSPILHPWPKLPTPVEQPARLPNSVPRSRGEALATLGLHKDADADLIEKTATTLRKSWHPDLATSPDDQALRHERSTAINAAVEILRRAA
jgi:hypothetical protein